MTQQDGFSFDRALTETPKSQLPPAVVRTEKTAADLVAAIREILDSLPDEISAEDALVAARVPRVGITGWHVARFFDAALNPNEVLFQAVQVAGKMRFRRLAPLMPCPGNDNTPCGKPTHGGVRCERCAEIEREDLWNFE